jgi:hypothetical protein
MVHMNEVLEFIISLRFCLERGDSVKIAVQNHIKKKSHTPFVQQLRTWTFQSDRQDRHEAFLIGLKSPYRRALFSLMERSKRGESIYGALLELEQEILDVCQADIDRHLAKLPFILLVPLLFMIFPAIMILLLGPFLDILANGTFS